MAILFVSSVLPRMARYTSGRARAEGTDPGTFLGGVQTIVTPGLLESAETKTAYFDVNLNPGAYAWVSEVPEPAKNGFLKPFIVPFEQR